MRTVDYFGLIGPILLLVNSSQQTSPTVGDADDPEECRTLSGSSAVGSSYQGKLNVAYDGTECLPWSKHPHFYRSHWSHERAVREENYCRNPDEDLHGPWCVVHKTSFKYCNVPRCARDVGCYDGIGEDYSGDQDRTSDGIPCKIWSHTSAIRLARKAYRFRFHQNSSHSITLRPTDDRLDKFKSCRNPGGTKSQPWCYTISMTGAKNEKNFCDVPKCSDPSTLGYALFNNQTKCAVGFVPKTQTLKWGETGERSVSYCLAPHRLLHNLNRQAYYSQFVDFCLYLVGKTTFCPAGFRRMQRFQPNLEKIRHISGPTAWRTNGDSLLQSTYCCSDPNYFTNSSSKLYIMMEKISRYKLVERSTSRIPWESEDSDPELKQTVQIENPSIPTVLFDDETVPRFASVRRCPPVNNMTRLLYLTSRNLIDTDPIMNLTPPMSEELLCEYYPVQAKRASTTPFEHTESSDNPASTVKLALFVGEPVCPVGFRKLHVPRQILFVLGTSSSLCEPLWTQNELQTPAPDAYCMPVVSSETSTVTDDDSSTTEWGKPTEFTCPEGFRPNEVHFTEPDYRLKLCCSGQLNDTESVGIGPGPHDSTDHLQAPFGFKMPFGVIQNGPRCPPFYMGSVRLNVMQFIRQIPPLTIDKLELIGQDDPIKPSGFLGISICQYLHPEMKLGVKSFSVDCLGLGRRSSITYSGVTCGFDINETTVFPPGKYCLLQISSNCPPGFVHQSGMVRIGFGLQALDSTCCRTEESIGAIRLPVKLEAPFKLPAVHRPCQAIENFNVDAELHHCVYYPQGHNPQALVVFPRIVRSPSNDTDGTNANVSVPAHCAIMPRRRRKMHRSQMGRLTTLFFNIMQDQWLIYKRPRWTGTVIDNGDVCFTEIPWSVLPRETITGESYCLFVFGSCPNEDFVTLGSSPYMNTVLCCTGSGSRSMESASDPNQQHRDLHSLVTLGRPMPEYKDVLNGHLGSFVLTQEKQDSTDGLEHTDSCPQFPNLRLHRRVAEGMPAPLPPGATKIQSLTELFNVTHMDDEAFTRKTGIWAQGDVVYVVYCEYNAKKPGNENNQKKDWPLVNFAIPKSLTECPKNSRKAVVQHRQDQFGFRYSQPIHLDGTYLQGEKTVWLEYCVFNGDSTRQSNYNYDVRDELPPGHYCVLRVRGYCPSGFEEGLLSILEGPENLSPNTQDSNRNVELTNYAEPTLTPDIERVRMHIKESTVRIDRLDYHFCCRADSLSVDSPIQGFPTDSGPFYLYRVSDKCQRLEGMRFTEEHVCMDTPNRGDPSWWSLDGNQTWVPYSVKGLTPARIPFHSHCDVEINLCYYETDITPAENESLTVLNAGEWPSGNYALPNVHRSEAEIACPPGFTQHHLSLINHQAAFFELQIMPVSLGPYFLELIGHNFSALNVHYCERDQLEKLDEKFASTEAPSASEESALQWPRGDYCVISTAINNQCPPGLHRHTRAIAELCCRSDNAEDQTPVDWPFVEDFFLFGSEKCLPIKNTHTERYLVRLVAGSDSKQESEWDVLCHYMPIDWVKGERSWPSGDYMLPIGRRSGLRTAMVNTVDYLDKLTEEHLPFNESQAFGQASESPEHSGYHCPESFERARFTFVSKSSEKRILPPVGNESSVGKEYNVVAMTAMEFCVREESNASAKNVPWPAGDYCVFTMNKECPVEMQAVKEIPLKIPRFVLKSVDLLDEYGRKLANKHWHADANNHVIYFNQCCREDKSLLLRLPVSDDGFYLASSSGLCSSVPGTLLDREKVTSYLSSPLTNRQSSTLNDRDMLLYRELIAQREGLMYLCYYHPVKQSDYSVAMAAAQLSTTLNMTESDLDAISELCGCAKNAFCIPQKQAECLCKPGYFGDGRHMCQAITPLTDECADLCDPAAVCAERLETGFRKKKQLLSHVCVCRSGYVGDGFTCRPSCSSRECQPFSRCVHNAVRGTTDCECIEGTVASDGRCHLDMYKSIQHEKDLPQFLVHYDNCLSEETQNAFRLLSPKKYFYVFVPEEIVRTCQDVTSHIAIRTQALAQEQLKSASQNSPIDLLTENDTIVKIYPMNGTWVIDGHLAQRSSIRFANGEMFLLSFPLTRKPHQVSKSGYYVAGLLTVLVLAVLAGCVAYYYRHYGHRRRHDAPLIPNRRRLLFGARFRRRQGESVLVEYPDPDE